ncbi:MAG: HD domain-containing protein [Desulfovibrio sp.]|uniref:HD domain-containing protein n=1 Tax=Desulfovibrio sp. 7SRBS1 TaxID=3378064 RepID=UPI003B3BF0E0
MNPPDASIAQDTDVFPLLDFLRRAEALKTTLRTARLSSGRQESTAEHSWRLCLFAMLVQKHYPALDALRVLQLCVVHDLGEAIHGDIAAPDQLGQHESKSGQEKTDLIDLLRPLPQEMQAELLDLWEEYEYARSPEARLVKALDKLETLVQHSQCSQPESVLYDFNLTYGEKYTGLDEFIHQFREAVDMETQACLLTRMTKAI